MSWFNHRTQYGGGAPAGAPFRRESAGSPPARMEGPGSAAGPETQSAQLRFTVRYALPEYVSFMWEHGGYLIRRRRIGTLASWWLLFKSTSAAALHFVTQGRSRHLYDFTVDQHGLIRANGSGVTLVPWSDVSAIRRYTRGYMVVLKRGTLPIPFRCLDLVQMAAMDAYAATLKAARKV